MKASKQALLDAKAKVKSEWVIVKELRNRRSNMAQMEVEIARLTEDLRRMDAITDILYASIEKRKLREQPRWKSDSNIISHDELERCTMTEQDNIVTLTMTEGIASLIARLRKEESNCASVYIIDSAIETIERLVKERDEARREVCNWSVGVGLKVTSQAVAKERGWDCYKETQ